MSNAFMQPAAVVDARLTQPITPRELETVLGRLAAERSTVAPASGLARALTTLPIGVGAAAVCIAVLLLG